MDIACYTIEFDEKTQLCIDDLANQICLILAQTFEEGEDSAVLFFHNSRISKATQVRYQNSDNGWRRGYSNIYEIDQVFCEMEKYVKGNRVYVITVKAVRDGGCKVHFYDDINPELFADDALQLVAYRHFGILPETDAQNDILQKAKKQEKIKTTLAYACYHNDLQLVEKMLPTATNLDLNKNLKLIGTPLHIACNNNNIKMAKLLIEHGADIEANNFLCYTPLLHTLNLGNEVLAEFFIEKGADVNKLGAQESSALELAIRSFIWKHILDILVQKGCDVNYVTTGGRDLLTTAASVGNIDATVFLLENNINKTFLSKALHAACWWGDSPEIVNYLIEKGANLKQVLEKDNRLLYRLCQWERIEMIECLLKHGVYFKNTSEDSQRLYYMKEYRFRGTPLEWAKICGKSKVVDLLEQTEQIKLF